MKQNVSQMNGGITRNVDVSVKNIIYFDDIINIKDFDKNNIKTDKKSYKSITHNIYYIVYVTIQKFEIRKNLQCKSFIRYVKQNEWII